MLNQVIFMLSQAIAGLDINIIVLEQANIIYFTTQL
jgi:hypothetical protein